MVTSMLPHSGVAGAMSATQFSLKVLPTKILNLDDESPDFSIR